MRNEIILFTDGNINIEVQINPEQETVWLTQKQMEVLFDVKHATVSEHITNILTSGELDETSVGFSDKSLNGSNKKSSGKSREFKLLLKIVEREKHSQKLSDCLRPPRYPPKT